MISVDFNEQNQNFNMSGEESDWVGLGDQWNILSVSGATETDPSWSALIDSEGNTTTVGLSLTGTVDSWRGVVLSPAENSENLLRDYIYNNSESISWTLNGLMAGGTYDMWIYASYAAWNNISVSSQSQTADARGGINYAGNDTRTNGVLLDDLVADESGVITGTAAAGFEWSGFQIEEVTIVPEPGTLGLISMGLGMAACFRRRMR